MHSQGGQGLNCCPRGEPCPPFFTHRPPSPRHPPHDENTGNTINNSLTLLFPPPSPLRLLLWSAVPRFPFINTVFDVGFISLRRPPNTSMCVIVLDSSWWWGYSVCSSWYWGKGLLSIYLQCQTLVLSIFSAVLHSCGSVSSLLSKGTLRPLLETVFLIPIVPNIQ